MKIINTRYEDYHMHSSNFSDGMNTVDEIVQFAKKVGLKKIAITDHSQVEIDRLKKGGVRRWHARHWKNVHNDVEVIFGIEADLLNEKGDICSDIGGEESEFTILSYHGDDNFKGTKKQAVKGMLNAIERFHDKISLIGHICAELYELEQEDIKKIILKANEYNIPLELDTRYFHKNPEKWDVLFEHADRIYFNSDAHVLYDLKQSRKRALEILKKGKYWKYFKDF